MATKTGTVILASATSVAAGATVNSSSVNLTAADFCSILAQITNGATAPTAACTATLQASIDGSNWYFREAQTAGIVASQAYYFSFDVPPGVLYVRVMFSGNTGQAVTAGAQSGVCSAL